MEVKITINLDNNEAIEADCEGKLPVLVGEYLQKLARKLSYDDAFSEGYSLPLFDGNGVKLGRLIVRGVNHE